MQFFKQAVSLVLIVMVTLSCNEDHSELIPGQDFIPDEILAQIRENGQPIYEGLNPPDVEGRYLMSPNTLVSSNFNDSSQPGRVFGDNIITFSEFDSKSLTMEVDLEQGRTTGTGLGSFISGEGDNFTIYVRIDRSYESGHTTLEARVFSGTIRENGILDLYTSLFMVNDGGDPDNELIGNGEGRLFRDRDGFSERY